MTNLPSSKRRRWLRRPTLAEFHDYLIQWSYASTLLVFGFIVGVVWAR